MSKLDKENSKLPLQKFNPYLIPLIFVLTVIPLIARMYYFDSGLSQFSWYPNDSQEADFFTYYKSVAFTIISAVMAIILIIKLIREKGKIKFLRIFLPLGVYALLSLLSSVLSDYHHYSFYGFMEDFETVWVLLGYCLVSYYAFLFVNTEKDIRILIRCFAIGTIAVLLVGLSQAFQMDIYRSELGKWLLLPASQRHLGTLDFIFEPGRVYLTLYNPNYVGSYAALIAPLFLILLFYSKKVASGIFYGAIFLALMLCLIASKSSAGLVGLTLSLLVLAFLFRKQLRKRLAITIGAFLSIIILFAVLDFSTNHTLTNKLFNMFEAQEASPTLNSITTNDDHMIIVYKNEPFSLRFQYFKDSGMVQFLVYDRNGKELKCQLGSDGITYTILDEPFRGIQFYATEFTDIDSPGFGIAIDGRDWYFTNQTDGTYYHINSYGKLAKLSPAEVSPLIPFNSFASGRGYIWSRTLPLLKQNLFIGTGADTFTFVFPNGDLIGALNGGYENILVSKPHNLYLQMGVQSGVTALLGFLVFYIIYLISSLRLYFKNNFESYLSQIGVAIFIGTLGYMICGIINDSTIAVAPIYWIFTGLGISINLLQKKDKKKTTE